MDHQKNTAEKVVAWFESSIASVKSFFGFLDRGPLGWIFRKLGAFGRWYKRRIWDRFAKRRDGSLGAGRGASVILATVFALYMIPALVLMAWQGALMAATMEREVIYLTSAEEVGEDIHSIRGCRKLPCSEADSTYFRVRSTLLHNVYSFTKRGNAFYPDYVASVVAPGVNRCDVTSYGIRVKALMRGWDIYPDMLDAVCTPYQTTEAFTQPDGE